MAPDGIHREEGETGVKRVERGPADDGGKKGEERNGEQKPAEERNVQRELGRNEMESKVSTLIRFAWPNEAGDG